MTAKSSPDHGKQIPATAPDPPCRLGCCPAGPAPAGLWAWRRGRSALCARGARALLPQRGQHPTTPVSSSPGRRSLWWTPINQSGGPEARRVHRGEVTHLSQACPPRLRCLLRAGSLWLCPAGDAATKSHRPRWEEQRPFLPLGFPNIIPDMVVFSFSFGCAAWLAGSQFPDQGLKRGSQR